MRRQALAKAAHQREKEVAEERERREKLAKADARNREEERVRKAEEHRLQVRACLCTRALSVCVLLTNENSEKHFDGSHIKNETGRFETWWLSL